MKELLGKQAFISDMDGVIYHGNLLLPGVKEFVAWLNEHEKRYIFLTNSSERSPRELRQKLLRLGLDVPEMMKLSRHLREAGVEGLRGDILTVEEMAVELCRLK